LIADDWLAGNSVCPPYLLVSYPELFKMLEGSPLLAPSSMVVVEYPKAEAKSIGDTLGTLVKLRDRQYGRTNVAIYGPLSAEVVPDD
jgi:16S rRNA G966 N2-methylase RsmD